MGTPQQTPNRLLAGLAPSDFALLRPELSRVELPLRKQLETRNRKIEHVYFPESGMASVIASAAADKMVEVGVIGNEGMSGGSILNGVDHSPFETFIQVAGVGWRIEAMVFRAAIRGSRSLHANFLRFSQVMMVQMASAALANAQFTLDARLARWLLMAQDRIGTPEIPLTHEFLSRMLGTRRAGVSTALAALKKKRVIGTSRAVIVIIDRAALIDASHDSYGLPEAEYARTIESSGRNLAA